MGDSVSVDVADGSDVVDVSDVSSVLVDTVTLNSVPLQDLMCLPRPHALWNVRLHLGQARLLGERVVSGCCLLVLARFSMFIKATWAMAYSQTIRAGEGRFFLSIWPVWT